MSALDRRSPPATVASMPGREAEKMAQRFHQLDAANRESLLEAALHLIDRQRDAKMPPREREAKKLVDRVTRCLDLIAETREPNAIGPQIWRLMIEEDRAQLAALGIDYFTMGQATAPIAADRAAPPARPTTWRTAIRHFYAAEYEYRRAGMEAAIMLDEGTPAQAAAASRDEQRAFRCYVDAVDRQMMLPTPTKAAGAWKARYRRVDGGRATWDAAIANDAGATTAPRAPAA